MEQDEVIQLIDFCFSLWPRSIEPSPKLAKAWHIVLAEFSLPEAVEAAKRICLEGAQFAPSPGEIGARIRKMTTLPKHTGADALIAAREAMRNFTGPGVFPNPAYIARALPGKPAVVKAMLATGLRRWFYADEKELSYVERDFLRHYEEASRLVEQQKEVLELAQGKTRALIGMAAKGGEDTSAELIAAGREKLRAAGEAAKVLATEALLMLPEDDIKALKFLSREKLRDKVHYAVGKYS